eukprot:TRINITY_DN9779_c0_g1_i1.p1 TRINITY_DN9779_c0_g1~~TRINITY_DN9779_c0_g1_i1.p1  ORF type:complete len:209 (-),score=50.07 TRINITY_DN9779_c0_g1_i1:119-745(-)
MKNLLFANILELRPTQFTLGMIEVKKRAIKLDSYDRQRVNKWLLSKSIPVVIGPNRELYMLDRHHSSRALWESSVFTKRMAIKIKADLSHLSEAEFWVEMVQRGWAYLYRHGEGPLDPKTLPKTIADLEDDPYRSLAWAVRGKKKAFKKKGFFSEFIWAEFLRSRIPSKKIEGELMWTALDEAFLLCTSQDASCLPGFMGRKDAIPIT